MAYREMSRMEIVDVVRRWQAGESRRAIGRGVGLARATVDKYVGGAEKLGLAVGGRAPTEDQVLGLVRQGRPEQERSTPARECLAIYREQIGRWLGEEHLRLTRVQELLAQQGVRVAYTTLRRFVAQEGLGRTPRTTVRMVESAPGTLGAPGAAASLASGTDVTFHMVAPATWYQ